MLTDRLQRGYEQEESTQTDVNCQFYLLLSLMLRFAIFRDSSRRLLNAESVLSTSTDIPFLLFITTPSCSFPRGFFPPGNWNYALLHLCQGLLQIVNNLLRYQLFEFMIFFFFFFNCRVFFLIFSSGNG